MQKGKIFFMYNDKKNPLNAGGIILYKIDNNRMYLLMIEKEGMYEDFGGNTKYYDETIHDVVSREAWEKSNKLLDKDSIKKRVASSKYIYNSDAKYISYFVHANEEEAKLTNNDFEKKEVSGDIPQKIKWVPANIFFNKNIFKHKLPFKLRHKCFLDIIANIEKNHSEWDILES